MIYTFGGCNQNGYLDSMERFNAHQNVQGVKTTWEEIILKTMKIPQRKHALMVPISSSEIFVFGGYRGQNLCDGYVFETTTDKV